MVIVAPLERGLLTPAEYLLREAKAEIRSEYEPGQIIAMSGGSFRHVRITSNLNTEMGLATRGKLCQYLGSELKVRIANGPRYFYPDGTIACPPNIVDEKNGAIDNPKVIFEVLSPGTEARDRGDKFFAYIGVESVEQIVLIASDRQKVDVWSRSGDGWKPEVFTEGILLLRSVGFELSLDDLYSNVVFEETATED
ncbi:Uma2 family endonuclease [bacterium]|nr:MAG: Uma2 family endonuclease [bacterium]